MADPAVATQTTSATSVAPPRPSRTPTLDDYVQESGHLRSTARALGHDLEEAGRRIGEKHHEACDAQINARARDIARRPPADLLDQLANRGFAWRDVARMIGVSVPAVRRWRQGESPAGPNLLSIARLLTVIEMLRTDHLIANIAAWMEMPLTPGAPLTAIDLAADGRYADLLELAADHMTPEDILDRWQPDWRNRYRSDIEVFEAADGEMGLRFTARQDD